MKKRSWFEWRLVPPTGKEYLPFYGAFQTRKGARIFQDDNLSHQGWRIVKVKVTEQ